MRTKTLGGHKRRAPSAPSLPSLPLLSPSHPQDEDNATMFETSSESDHDPQDLPMADSIDQNESIDLLDKNICICCNKGGGVLVCSGMGCPVTLHASCIDSEPKFDDSGNFFCPYCWYKQAVDKCQELRKKAMAAKRALSNFLDKDEAVQTGNTAKTKEAIVGDGICLDGDDRHGTDGVHIPHLQPEPNQPSKLHKVDHDQNEIPLNGQADADGDFGPCRDEEMPVHIKPVQESMNQDKFDKADISERHETRFFKGKETEDSRRNMEDGQSQNTAFAKGAQESVAKSAENKEKIKHKGKVPQREQKVASAESSMSETNDSEFEAISVKKGRTKKRVKKTAYKQKVTPVRKSLLQEHSDAGKNAVNINEEVTSSRTLREPQRSPNYARNHSLLLGRRRKLHWTAEEETVLKEGVLKFSAENHNIPWKKILQYGHRVFDNTRTPVDLKDKWRNITSKEGSK